MPSHHVPCSWTIVRFGSTLLVRRPAEKRFFLQQTCRIPFSPAFPKLTSPGSARTLTLRENSESFSGHDRCRPGLSAEASGPTAPPQVKVQVAVNYGGKASRHAANDARSSLGCTCRAREQRSENSQRLGHGLPLGRGLGEAMGRISTELPECAAHALRVSHDLTAAADRPELGIELLHHTILRDDHQTLTQYHRRQEFALAGEMEAAWAVHHQR